MLLSNGYQFIDQLLLCDVALCFHVITVISINPHAPLIIGVDGDEILCDFEASKTVV